MIILKILCVLYITKLLISRAKMYTLFYNNPFWIAITERINQIEQGRSKMMDMVNSNMFLNEKVLRVATIVISVIEYVLLLLCIYFIAVYGLL